MPWLIADDRTLAQALHRGFAADDGDLADMRAVRTVDLVFRGVRKLLPYDKQVLIASRIEVRRAGK